MEIPAARSCPRVSRSLSPACEPSEPSDDDLAREAQAGATGAFEQLAQRYRGRIYVFALALLRRPDDAEDVAQETCLRAWRGLRTYEPRGQFRTWLFGIAVNICREHRRFERRRSSVPLPEAESLPAEAAPDPGALYDQAALKTAVRAAVARLPEIYRAPVVLYHLEELSIAEVAAILRQSTPAVKMRLWRARRQLARELAGWLEGDEG